MAAGVLGGCSSSAQGGTASTADTSSAASTTASSADSGNVIRVGVVCSMTGGSAIYGEGAQNAVDMAVEEINSGDSGYTVEIVNGGKVADDAKDAKQAMNAYNKVMADSPAAIVGSFFSSVTLPMATQAANDGMLLLATGATNVDVTQKGSTIFRNCFIDPYQGKMAALFVKSKGFSKVAVIYAKDDDYSNGLKDAFVENCEANGIEITYTGECMSTDTDFFLPGSTGRGFRRRVFVLSLLPGYGTAVCRRSAQRGLYRYHHGRRCLGWRGYHRPGRQV